MPGRPDPRGAVHVEAEVPVAVHGRRAGVQPDPDPCHALGVSLLDLARRGDRLVGAGEGEERLVAVLVDDRAAHLSRAASRTIARCASSSSA